MNFKIESDPRMFIQEQVITELSREHSDNNYNTQLTKSSGENQESAASLYRNFYQNEPVRLDTDEA